MSTEKNWLNEAGAPCHVAKVGTTRFHEKALQSSRVGNAALLIPHMLKAARSNRTEIEAFVQKLRDACVDTFGTAADCSRTANLRRNIFVRQMSRGIDAPPEPPTFEEMLELHFLELTPFEFLNFLEELDRQFQVAVAKSENGQILSGEGRAAWSKTTAASDRIIANLYRTVRPSFSPGGTGNVKAIKVVADRHQQRTGRDKPVCEKTIRNALKRCGIPCR